MSTFWKWFLGILLALAIFAAGVFAGVMAPGQMGFEHSRMFIAGGPFEEPMGEVIQVGPDGEIPEGAVVQFGVAQPSGREHFDGRQHGDRFGGHHDGFELLGGLIHLVLFAGLVYGAYWLGRRNARIVLDPSTGSGRRPGPVAPVKSAPAPEAAPAKRSGKKIA